MMTPRIYNYLVRLCKTDWVQLENPAIKLQQNAKAAQAHINAYKGKYPPPHPDPEVRRIIEMDDDEYDKHLAEIKRQSGYWYNAPRCDVITLIMRSLRFDDDIEYFDDSDIECFDDEDELPELPHADAREARRRRELPELAERVRNMRTSLLEKVVGQDHAVHAFAERIFNAEVIEDADRKRPAAVFTFAGPPGVGKTFLAEQAAELLGLPCRRFDMTEYASRQNEEGLIGIDYFYGHSSPGKLTSFVKENPKCVLIFDA